MTTYVVNPDHTFPSFSYDHLGLSRQRLRCNRVSGTVDFDAQARQARVDVVIDMQSVDTGSPTFDHHIQGADFFDTARHPTATYKSTRVVFDGERPVKIEGELTLKGITRPVELTLASFFHGTHPMANQPAIGANATGVLRRSDFGAGKYAPAIGDEVTLSISLEAAAA